MTVMTRPDSGHDTLLTMYATMVRTRMCETAVLRQLATLDHGVGYLPVRDQEAVAAGTIAALEAGDRLVTTKRCLHELIACGVPLREVVGMLLTPRAASFTEPLARAHGVIFSTGTPGAGVPVAAGAALAAKVMGSGRVVITSFGDGATDTGAFHEGANLAAVLQLPLVLLCRNNLHHGSTPVANTTRINHVASRAHGYGIPGQTVDGTDPVKVRRAVAAAVNRARQGGGPSLVECVTYRPGRHRAADGRADALRDEPDAPLPEDPLLRYERWLTATGVDPDTLVRISASAMSEVDQLLAVIRLSTSRRRPGGRR
ncbi:thiamine pyrophosphate-dependent enzyme [Amycolatopsis sp. RTGN1]|uniref:thiamine pyrophosphate-dependent enzyme n=1 Tax=Amycolatopsis ponsaeliensis TaxID=2992142 RepID=UPI00254F9518|nr:thiamine pyrophosphate-dependent enzyme [Amycolatopsis sp. RTGN1]